MTPNPFILPEGDLNEAPLPSTDFSLPEGDLPKQTVLPSLPEGDMPPPTHTSYISSLESNNDPYRKNPNSTAFGLGQFLYDTRKDILSKGVIKNRDGSIATDNDYRTDPHVQQQVLDTYTQNNSKILQANALPVTNESVYAMHHFGPGYGVRFNRATDDTPMSSILNQEALTANPYLANLTKGQLINNWNQRYNKSYVKTEAQKQQEQSFQLPEGDQSIMFNVNGKVLPGIVYDGDTIIINDGSKHGMHFRMEGIDTGETTKFKGDIFKAGSYTGGVQAEALRQLANSGYNIINYDPKKKDTFNRYLATATNQGGQKVSTEMVSQRLANVYDPAKDKDQLFARNQMDLFEAMHGYRTKVPAIQQSKDMYDYLNNLVEIERQVPNTNEELASHKYWTSDDGLKILDDDYKKLNAQINSGTLTGNALDKATADRDTAYNKLLYFANQPKNMYTFYSREGQPKELGVLGTISNSLDKGFYGMAQMGNQISGWAANALDNKPLEKRSHIAEMVNASELERLEKQRHSTTMMETIHSPSKILDFTANTFTQYLPQLATIYGASKLGYYLGGAIGAGVGTLIEPGGGTALGWQLGSAVGGTVLGASTTVGMGIADWYGEQPDDEKNWKTAAVGGIVIGALDYIGFKGATVSGRELLTEAGRKELLPKIVAAGKAATIPEAEKLLNRGIYQVSKDFSQEIASLATDQIIARNALKDTLWAMTKSAGLEATTESLQEAIQAVGMNMTTSANYSYQDILQRMLEAGGAGGIIGAAIHGPHAWAESKQINQNLLGGDPLSEPSKIAEQREQVIRNNKGKDLSVLDISRRAKEMVEEGPSLQEEGNEGKFGVGKAITKLITNPLSDAKDSFFKAVSHSPFLHQLAGLLDSHFTRGVYAGISAPKHIAYIINGSLATMSPWSSIVDAYGVRNMEQASKLFYSGTTNTGNLALAQNIVNVASTLIQHNENLGGTAQTSVSPSAIMDLLTKLKVIDPATNLELLKQDLYKYTIPGTRSQLDPNEVDKMIGQLKGGYGISTLFDFNELGILDNPEFDKYLRKDVSNNINELVSTLSSTMVSNAMFGERGQVANNLINKALSLQQITPEKAKELKTYAASYINAINGRIPNWESKPMQAIQSNAVFIQTMISMDTSLFSQFGDIGVAMFGLQGLDKLKFGLRFGIDFGLQLASSVNNLASKLTAEVIPKQDPSKWKYGSRLQALRETGHMGDYDDITVRTGLITNNRIYQAVYKAMFAINGVEMMANAVRSARLSLSHDKLNQLMTTYLTSPDTTSGQYARDRLANYRIPLKEMSDLFIKIGSNLDNNINNLTPAEQARFKDLITQAEIHFVDEFAVRPEIGSGPYIFDDARYTLVTQFQRFMANMTTQVIPQLWEFYIRRGTPQIKFSTFNTIITTMALSYAGFALKQALAGTDDKDDDKKDAEYYLAKAWDRAGFMGILSKYGDIGMGAADLLTDIGQRNPIAEIIGSNHSKDVYKNKDPETTGKNAFNYLTSLAPSINTGINIGSDTYKMIADDDEKAKERMVRRVPFLGDLSTFRESAK